MGNRHDVSRECCKCDNGADVEKDTGLLIYLM